MGQQPQRTSSGESSQSFVGLSANKKCPSCNKDLPLQSFYTAGRSKAGHTRLHSHCKRCKLQRESRRRCVKALRVESQELDTSVTDFPSTLPPSRGHLNRVPEHHSGTKLCTSCQHTKPLSSFYTAGRHKGGAIRWHSHCKGCKLEHEAAQRMQPRRDSRELHKAGEGMAANPAMEQHVASASTTFPQHPHATSLPHPMMLQHVPPFLNPQQLQSMMLLNQHPAMFRNPVLQSQLAMLMWSQMQHPQAPLWSLPQPANVMQPTPVQQPHSLAAQSASTHQPSNPAPTFGVLRSAPSLECNSSGGSNDSGCMQAPNDDSPKAQQSPSLDGKLVRSAFDNSSRFAEDSDSAVTWAGKSGQQAQQLAFPSGSVSHADAQGVQQSGQLSGRDLSSSYMADAAHWRMSESPAAEPATAADSTHLAEPTPPRSSQPAPASAPAQSFPHAVHQAAAASTEELLPRKASSSLLADLRQAQQQQRQQQQQHQYSQAPALLERQDMSTSAAEQHAQNLKRSSRQAAKAAEQAIQAAQAILSPQQTQQQPQHQLQQQQAAAVPQMAEPPLHWGSQKRAVRVRGHRHPALRAGMLLPNIPAAAASLRVANAGVSKPSLPRHMQAAGPQIPLFRQPAPAFPAAASVPRALESQATMAARHNIQQPLSLSVSGAQAASKQPSGEQMPSFTPRHSRKKGKVQRSAFE